MRRKWKELYDLPEIVSVRETLKKAYNNKLKFIEESHQYFLDGVEYTCVSDIIHKWVTTNEEEMLEKCAKKAQIYPDYKYFGMSKDEIKAKWESIAKEACDFGTACHAFGESCFYWFAGEDDKILPECKDKFDENGPHPTNGHEEAILKFWNDIPECIVPVLAENKVFNQPSGENPNETPYAGTFDILFYYCKEPNSPKNGLIIMDYKTNGSLTNDFARNKGQMMLFPFQDMYDESLEHYYLQFSLYQIPIENLGYKVLGRRLIWLKPDGTYEKKETPDETKKLREVLSIPKNKRIII